MSLSKFSITLSPKSIRDTGAAQSLHKTLLPRLRRLMCGGAAPRRGLSLNFGLRPRFGLCPQPGPEAERRAQPKGSSALTARHSLASHQAAEPRQESLVQRHHSYFRQSHIHTFSAKPSFIPKCNERIDFGCAPCGQVTRNESDHCEQYRDQHERKGIGRANFKQKAANGSGNGVRACHSKHNTDHDRSEERRVGKDGSA